MYAQHDTDPSTPEEVVPFRDPKTGVRGAIVLHSTALGPAAGGCRIASYVDDAAMMEDGLRLAHGMTLKNALAELPMGGGKAVLRLPSGDFDREALFRAVGRAVNDLGGRYVTAEDAGTTVADMTVVAGETRYVAGLAAHPERPGGDPSPWTARGVLAAMRVAVRHRLGADLSDVTVAVQGLGHVGFHLCQLLHEAGTRLLVAEPRSDVAARAATRFGAMVMSSQALLTARADVLAPCAMGAVLDFPTVQALAAKVVCGAANNQLFGERQDDQLAGRGILYAPDFLVNAGGIINVAGEYLGWTVEEVETRVKRIGERFADILARASADQATPLQIARSVALDRIARNRVAAA
ncbi:Glu/Leu/Phe/Val family dehydrogenase [Sphingomonas carotinifaciens]|uniref:Amino acid dehydrogenase n=1 Tax=Sphingomonas carotinifaciens TaxID=1166323 RepID=A0A1G7PUP3_9SPHN|nr:Glu/Leu/Phe/Val dehydrogenase dimerization domain-containing protein [Sphingomonas carotinifaciens]MBB4087511.1 leucine dehydrogenase [Sphingomonas carotinifaciens]MWC45597.1 amino acid dehydrogenase [Sphingomonas carotinifaciens]SDF89923.1 leucine dehydrogenase [Sphingomonas carotinifaciens]